MPNPEAWLFFIHNIPSKPAYLRTKVAKRLAGLGAVALKNAVYVLPALPRLREDMEWLAKEIQDGGGRAFAVDGTLTTGLDDVQVRALFQEPREQEYAALITEAKVLSEGLEEAEKATVQRGLTELRRKAQAIQALDYFGAPSRGTLDGMLAAMESRLAQKRERDVLSTGLVAQSREAFLGKTWVTRSGVHVDRIASAWLIRRFFDSEARFRFVEGATHSPAPGEATFDMQGADFTHQDDHCTFETLVQRLGMDDPTLARLGEMVHDIDLHETLYQHPETAGLETTLAGVALRHAEDMARIDAGSVVFDALYEALRLTA